MKQIASAEPQVLPPTDLRLTVPKEVSDLAVGTDRFVVQASEFEVDSEAALQVVDEVQSRLKAEAKQINEKRLEFTRPIDAIKKQWMDFFSPAIDGRLKAVGIYQGKMSGYLRAKREEDEKRRREAEAVLARERERIEAEIRRKEEAAAKLKTEEARNRKLAEASALREVASITPVSVPVAPRPETVASNVSEPWTVENITDPSAFLRWLADHPEWHKVLGKALTELNTRAMSQFADQWHTLGVPGVKFTQGYSFRTKPR